MNNEKQDLSKTERGASAEEQFVFEAPAMTREKLRILRDSFHDYLARKDNCREFIVLGNVTLLWIAGQIMRGAHPDWKYQGLIPERKQDNPHVERLQTLLGPCVLLNVPRGEKDCKTPGWQRRKSLHVIRPPQS